MFRSRLLRYVVAFAEELHFTRAAERLHVAQPSLSQQILDLEEELETKLFNRNKRGISLTEAGVLFVEMARKSLEYGKQARIAVRSVRSSTHLQIGYSPYVNPELILAVRSLLEATLPKFTLELKSYFTRRQIAKLQDGKIDAALVILLVIDSGVVVEPLLSESLLVALPDGHRLARHRSVALSDLRDIPVVSFPQKLHPEVYQQLLDGCARAGLTPKIGHEVTTFPEALALVAQGKGYTFIRKCFTPFFCPGVVLRPVKGNPLTLETGVAYLKRGRSPQVDAFLSSLKRLGNVDGGGVLAA